MILIIDKKGTTLRYRAGGLEIERSGQKKRRVPVNQLEQLIVYGNVMVETGVWRAIAGAGIPAVMLANRGNSSPAMIGSGLATQLPIRQLQFRHAECPQMSLELARWFVDLKLQSYDLPLVRKILKQASTRSEGYSFQNQVDHYREKLKNTRELNVIIGLEGSIARTWFALLARYIPFKWKFAGRNRRPPRDPVNALLSLGYTLAHSELRQVLISNGLDPSLGFLHQAYPGREALALDFVEIFRSGVDYFVLDFIEDQPLGKTEFYYRESTGCHLSKSARPMFYQAWAQYRENWPRPLAAISEKAGWPTAPLKEQAVGQLALIREYMVGLEK